MKGAGAPLKAGLRLPSRCRRVDRYSARTLCLLRPAGGNGNATDIIVTVHNDVYIARREIAVSHDSIRPRAAIDRVVAGDVVRDVDVVIPAATVHGIRACAREQKVIPIATT